MLRAQTQNSIGQAEPCHGFKNLEHGHSDRVEAEVDRVQSTREHGEPQEVQPARHEAAPQGNARLRGQAEHIVIGRPPERHGPDRGGRAFAVGVGRRDLGALSSGDASRLRRLDCRVHGVRKQSSGNDGSGCRAPGTAPLARIGHDMRLARYRVFRRRKRAWR